MTVPPTSRRWWRRAATSTPPSSACCRPDLLQLPRPDPLPADRSSCAFHWRPSRASWRPSRACWRPSRASWQPVPSLCARLATLCPAAPPVPFAPLAGLCVQPSAPAARVRHTCIIWRRERAGGAGARRVGRRRGGERLWQLAVRDPAACKHAWRSAWAVCPARWPAAAASVCAPAVAIGRGSGTAAAAAAAQVGAPLTPPACVLLPDRGRRSPRDPPASPGSSSQQQRACDKVGAGRLGAPPGSRPALVPCRRGLEEEQDGHREPV